MDRTRMRLRAAAGPLPAGSAVSVSALPALLPPPLVGRLAVAAGRASLPAERLDPAAALAAPVTRRGR